MKFTVQMQVFADGDPVTDLDQAVVDTRYPWTDFALRSPIASDLWRVHLVPQNAEHIDAQPIRGWWPFLAQVTHNLYHLCNWYTPGLLYLHPSDCPSVTWMPNTQISQNPDWTPPAAWALMLRTIASEVPTP